MIRPGLVGLGVLVAAALAAAQSPTADSQRLFPMTMTWSVDLGAEPVAAPVADAARVYVALRSGQVVARSRVDGREVWSVDLATRLPIAADGALLFVAADGAIHALRVGDGAAAWSAHVGTLPAPFLVRAGWLIAGIGERTIVALRARDGQPIWLREVAAPLASAPEIEGRRVYLPLADGRLVALQIERGEPVWERRLNGTPGGVLALEDRVYVGATDNFLYCLASRTGEVLWRWRTAADVAQPPVVDERRLYFVSFDNVLRALDHRTGVQRWKRPLLARHVGGPQVVTGVVMVTLPVSKLYFYLGEDGKPAAAIGLPAPMVAAPTPVEPTPWGGRLFVVTSDTPGDAWLHALGPGDDPPLVPLTQLPGRVLRPEVLPPTRGRPAKLPALPALPPRGG